MKQIKTIFSPNPTEFDAKVNEAMEEGWGLTRREVIPAIAHDRLTMLYAELERDVITEEYRCCENCQHYDKDPESEPCASCSENTDNWEGYNA